MGEGLAGIESVRDLARLLRQLRRREARERGQPELTYREIAAKTGWSIGAIGGYFSGTSLPSTIRFDALVRLLGATPAEQGALATARDRIAERVPPAAAGEPVGSVPAGVSGPAGESGPAGGSAPAARGVPHQLPADICGFTGRARQLAELDGLLAGSGVGVAALSGTAGVGKTVLAVHWAHRVADRFPAGQLYADLRGFDMHGAPLSSAAAARGFLLALGLPARQIPAGFDELIALYRSTLATRRLLVVLDNAHDPAQVRPLLPGGPGSVVVITSRDRMTGLIVTSGARPLRLDLLSSAEARQMLAHRLGADRLAAEPTATIEIIGRCSGLPLALAVAAARAVVDELSLTDLATELAAAGRRLDALGAGDAVADVRTVISWSYRALPAEAAGLFRLVGLHPGPDISVATAASLAGVTPARARALLVELSRVNLLAERSPGRFSCHDLLRAYAGELADPAERATAIRRALDHYGGTAHTAATLLEPGWGVAGPADPAPGVRPEPLADREAALAWFTAEYPALLAMIPAADEHRFDRDLCQLVDAVGAYQHLRGHWAQWVESLTAAADAVTRLADPGWRAWFHRSMISANAWAGAHEESLRHADIAIDLYRALRDHVGEARCHRSSCLALESLGRYREALDHAVRSRDLLRDGGDQALLAYAFNSVGWYQALVGDHPAALENCRQAIPLLQACADLSGEATTWDSIGYAHHHLGQYGEAVKCYERALALFRSTEDRYYEADTLDHLADTLLAIGDHDGAAAAWRQALVILDELRHPEAATVRAKLGQSSPAGRAAG